MLKQDAHHQIDMGSDRSFGLVFAAVFLAFGVYFLVSGSPYAAWILGAALVFAMLAFAFPAALRPLNRAWFLFGLLLGRVVAPLVMIAVYLLAITPTGILMHWAGKDPLRLRRPLSRTATFWQDRRSDDRKMGSMNNQY